VETSDKQFILTFIGVSGALVLIAVGVLVAANLVGERPYDKSAAQIRIAEARIEPVGKVNLKSAPVHPADAPLASAAKPEASPRAPAGEISGEKVYSGICQSCHMSGVAGAPIVGDAGSWEARIAQGIEALYQSAIKGKGLMPPKGGNPALSDEEIQAAVDFMVESSQ
jgi:cytochrome c5